MSVGKKIDNYNFIKYLSPLGRSADINNELQAEDDQRIEIRPDTTDL